jgi:serine/threonine protein kinase
VPPVEPRLDDDTPAVAPSASSSLDQTTPLPQESRAGGDRKAPEAAAAQAQADAPAQAAPGPAGTDGDELKGVIGGYEIVYRLGKGGMGAVYLAKQLSLSRNVALKTLLKDLADDAAFVARFTREAYAAAQLVHHNVVQIYDLGEQKRTHFFTMEFVEGRTLGQLIRERGRLPAEEAVAYAIQAARGLKFAHEHGMVHRDIKPENLMVNRHGIVKVADLGLVKVAPSKDEVEVVRAKKAAQTGNWYDTGTTDFNTSMGTPTYMPPEQARDAANVDHRADIYSLGCTLYALLTGRPPFTGKTAEEVITKHLKEQVMSPDLLVEGIGPNLSAVIMKMTAKKAEDRYQSMDEVILALEAVIGVHGSGEYEPSEEQRKAVENCANWFNNNKLARIRRYVVLSFFPACALALLAAIMWTHSALGALLWVGGLLGFTVLTPVCYEAIRGADQRTIVWLKFRQMMFSARITEWVVAFVMLLIACAILWSLNLQAPVIAFAATSMLVAIGVHFGFDKPIAKERREPIEALENVLRQLRGRGISEAAVQQFVCRDSGEQWEELYEAMFGYEAKLIARSKWAVLRPPAAAGSIRRGDRGTPRPKFAAWRDPLIAWIDRKLELWRTVREQQFMEKIEMARLRAKGYAEVAAKKNARRFAQSLVLKAAEVREEARHDAMEVAPPPPPPPPPPEKGAKQPAQAPAPPPPVVIEQDKGRKKSLSGEAMDDWEQLSYFQRRWGGLTGLFFGPAVRFCFGCILLLGCLAWAKQNNLLSATAVAGLARVTYENTDIIEGADIGAFKAAAEKAVTETVDTEASTVPLTLSMVPPVITDFWDDWWPGLAGALLILSSFFDGALLGLLVVIGGVLLFAGERMGIPPMGKLNVAATLGIGLSALGFLFGRD